VWVRVKAEPGRVRVGWELEKVEMDVEMVCMEA
jgi:hypothetical protein